jgi:aspartate aminotransferase-like enzyme
MEGRIIRIGHMGWVHQDELAAVLRALQIELNSLRAPTTASARVA